MCDEKGGEGCTCVMRTGEGMHMCDEKGERDAHV